MSQKKVLIVDDEIHIVHVVAIKLKNNGYEIMSAHNGMEAYELACTFKPDIIVTDYQMPIMTGMELVEKIRQNDELKNTPVIMLTARSFAISKEQQESLQISDCLSKPFSPRELLVNIEDILYQKELVTENSI